MLSKFLRWSSMIFIIKGFRGLLLLWMIFLSVFILRYFLLQVSNNAGILNTCTWLWLTESEQATPVDSIKDVVRCRNFGKELVILFHRSAAAPWGHVASIIKKRAPQEILSLLVPIPTLLTQVHFVAPLDGIRILVPSTTGTQERRTHVLSLKQQDTHS